MTSPEETVAARVRHGSSLVFSGQQFPCPPGPVTCVNVWALFLPTDDAQIIWRIPYDCPKAGRTPVTEWHKRRFDIGVGPLSFSNFFPQSTSISVTPMIDEESSVGTALVFGGCGFLGHHIAKQLTKAPDVTKVFVFDADTSKNRISGVEYISGSITSQDDVDAAFKNVQPKVIFHTVSPGPFLKDNKLFDSVNVGGTKNIIASAQKHSCTRALVYTSSSSVIHDNRSDLIRATEDAPVIFMPEQTEYYSHTKAVAETLVLGANGHDIRTAAIRPAGLFGKGDTGTVTSVISNAREGKGRMQIGDNSNLFDWTYVENNAYAQLLTARALLKSFLHTPGSESDRVDGEAFAITNDDPWHFWTFTRALAAAAGYPVAEDRIIQIPWIVMMGVAWTLEWGYWILSLGSREPRLNRARVKYTTMQRTLDITKAKKRLGYRPQVSMQEGIDRSAKWFLESAP